MTFPKPFSGTFTYKGLLPSSVMNAINNAFPSILDKTGDTVTGTITWAAGSAITMQGSSVLTLDTGASLIIDSTSFLTMNSGSELTIENSAFITLVSGSALIVQLGADLQVNDGGLITFESGSQISGNIDWTSATSNPTLGQTTIAGANGTTLTVKAQSTSTNGFNGGNLVLASGGATLGNPGIIELKLANTTQMEIGNGFFTLYPFSSTGYALSVNSWQNAANTQVGFYNITPYFASTLASGSNVTFATFNISNSTAMVMDISWIRRGLAGSGCLSNQLRLIAICNGGGTVSASDAVYITPSGAFADGTDLAFTYGTNSIAIAAVAQTAAMDWQIVITMQQI